MSPDRFSDEAILRVLAFDPAAAIRKGMAQAAAMPVEKRERIRRGMERARLDAALYLARRWNSSDRAIARDYLRHTRGAA